MSIGGQSGGRYAGESPSDGDGIMGIMTADCAKGALGRHAGDLFPRTVLIGQVKAI